ncbi:MAG TPA: response regulator [Ktedonobacteraceae bacterium]|jgi:DNA-binding response OmpR family regulator|nr:response regulator [Ktedonobacteraceae bacterium]
MSSGKITPDVSGQEKTILIIDDDHDIGEMLRTVITQQTNYRVVWIAESDLALEAASHMRPSLLLLDYMMPTMDGLKLYDYLQDKPNMRGVPVVMISAWATLPFEQIRERGMYMLRKPFDLSDLLDILAELLSNESAS